MRLTDGILLAIGIALVVYVVYHVIQSNQPDEDASANTPINSGDPAPNPHPNPSWIAAQLKAY